MELFFYYVLGGLLCCLVAFYIDDKLNHSNKERKIYRFEDCEGIGPYQSKIFNYNDSKLVEHNLSRNHPCPPTHIFKKNRKAVCGFSSIRSLTNWFSTEELEILKNEGFKLYVYYVRNKEVFFESDRQVVFNRRGTSEEISY